MRLSRINNTDQSLYGYFFECPGCKDTHVIPTVGPKAWGFNNDLERPTFTPSILVHPHKVLGDNGEIVTTPRCHSFVRDGRIEYLTDSTHALAGQTVDLPDVKEEPS